MKVMASFYPLQYLTEKIGGDLVSVESLTPPGAEPHDLELSNQKVQQLSQAGAVVYLKGFQSAVDKAIELNAPKTVIDVSTSVDLVDAEKHESELDVADDGEKTEEAHEHEHEHGSTDPHFWLDPTRMADAAKQVHAALVKADPSHKADYDANLKTTLAKLTKLDTSYKQGLSQCTRKTFVTSHAAFGYLAERYGLTQVSVSGIDPDSEPSPADIAKVKQVVKQTGTTTIFTEELVSPKTAQAVAKETGAKTSVLSPIESAPEKGDYEGAMTTNLTNLREALNCK